MKVANNIKLELDTNGAYVSSATIANAAERTSVRAAVKDSDSIHEYRNDGVAQWSTAALDNAAYTLESEGSVVVNGVTIADKVTARFAKHQGDALTLDTIELSAVAPRPQSAKELREIEVADIMAQDLPQADLIAALTALAIG